jgi:hypothetical protein
MQDRRGFLKMLVGGVAAAAAVRSFPFRTFSFPTQPEIVPAFDFGPHIAGWVSYRIKFTVTMPPDTNMRIRYIGMPDAREDYLVDCEGVKIPPRILNYKGAEIKVVGRPPEVPQEWRTISPALIST